MPLKDVEKLTVVKLRAELTARGLDAKGNKPFLVERLRAALEREEQAGVTHLTEAKVCSSEEQVGELITEQEYADMVDRHVSDLDTSDSSDCAVLKLATNGTTPTGQLMRFTPIFTSIL